MNEAKNNGKRTPKRKEARILVVTPEITHLPPDMGNMAHHLTAKGGGLADVSATLVSALFEHGADIHVALPHYRKMFNINIGSFINDELRIYKSKMPGERIHLAEDRAFYYESAVYGAYGDRNQRVSLIFQREVINNIIPRVRPDLIHCNDWMTGLIPAYARRLGIPCLFTIHNIHTTKVTMAAIEDNGIDAAEFWQHLYFERHPENYEQSRHTNGVDFLTTGVFAAHFINTVSASFLTEIMEGRHDFVGDLLRAEIKNKGFSGCAAGVLNSPDPSYNPASDSALKLNYGPDDHEQGKHANKEELQKVLELEHVPEAPILFWPSRLDPVQKGCQLLTEILYTVVAKYWERNLQIVIVASGPYQCHFQNIVHFHRLRHRVAVCDFNEHLSRLAYAASDFMLMPSRFEPCGLPQMISQIYGSLPIARKTGGIQDTVFHLDMENDRGNGFLFEHYDGNGLLWAIDQAMGFYSQPLATRRHHVSRIMRQSVQQFHHDVTARQYWDIYQRMLARPMFT